MLNWVAERNYIFYVKDLVKYLKETTAFEGHAATVRRRLLKAGLKIKLVSLPLKRSPQEFLFPTIGRTNSRRLTSGRKPWHKSQITTWIPASDDLVNEVTTSEIQQTGRRRPGPKPMKPKDSASDRHLVPQQPIPTPLIDPALTSTIAGLSTDSARIVPLSSAPGLTAVPQRPSTVYVESTHPFDRFASVLP